MDLQNDKRFYIDFNTIRVVFPREVGHKVVNFGVLEQYKDKKYTLKEVNEIVAELVIKSPFIPNAMSLRVNVMGIGYHHMLDFKNYNYEKQKRKENEEIEFLYE